MKPSNGLYNYRFAACIPARLRGPQEETISKRHSMHLYHLANMAGSEAVPGSLSDLGNLSEAVERVGAVAQ